MGEDLKIGTTILLLNGATSCVSRHIQCSLSALFFFFFLGYMLTCIMTLELLVESFNQG
jgi:hypothetical protein